MIFSNYGNEVRVISMSSDTTICIWDVKTGNQVDWLYQGWRMIVSGEEDGHVMVRNVEMKEICPITRVSSVACSFYLIRKQLPLHRMIMAHSRLGTRRQENSFPTSMVTKGRYRHWHILVKELRMHAGQPIAQLASGTLTGKQVACPLVHDQRLRSVV